MAGYPAVRRRASGRALWRVLFLLCWLNTTQARADEAAAAAGGDVQSVTMPVISSAAPKLERDLMRMPLSVSTVTDRQLEQSGYETVKDAGARAPNTTFTEFSARKLSNPRFRGVGASPQNPSVTTYIDGVPQLHAGSSSLELLDVEQLDFVRGPQGALFGRNTVGGLINLTSRRPELRYWRASAEGTVGEYDLFDTTLGVSGPLVEQMLGLSLYGGYAERDGYTINELSGDDIDARRARFGKAQLLLTPDERWEFRLIMAGERDRDGDYALHDLAALRARPHRAARDFEGFTARDVWMPTLQAGYQGEAFDFRSITGYVRWETLDETDLDYSPLPLATRRNREEMDQWTQELIFSSPKERPLVLSETATLSWLAGGFCFQSDYGQHAYSDLAPGVGAPIALRNGAVSDLEDWGAGAYGQVTLTLRERLRLTAGLRWDYEAKDAVLTSYVDPVVPASTIRPGKNYDRFSPQAAVAYEFIPELITYAAVAGGYKAGGFNPQSPPGRESFGEETSWNYELGCKGRLLENRLSYGLALFYTEWEDLQLNQPLGLGQFYIDNAGAAVAKGVELQADYYLSKHLSLYGSVGWLDAEFSAGAREGGRSVGGNRVPFSSDYTAFLGARWNADAGRQVNVFAQAEAQFVGGYDYDAANTAGQDAYALVNVRLGARTRHVALEGFIHNAFDEAYIPVGLPYAFAPSGFVGESGAPRAAGVRLALSF